MSNLIVSNVSDGTTSVPTGYVVNGSAKAWGSFDQYYTNSMLESFNISSFSDLGTGAGAVNLSSAMTSASYPYTALSYVFGVTYAFVSKGGSTASQASIVTMRNDSTTTAIDPTHCCFSVHGDLA
jgi:hypothetical protein